MVIKEEGDEAKAARLNTEQMQLHRLKLDYLFMYKIFSMKNFLYEKTLSSLQL